MTLAWPWRRTTGALAERVAGAPARLRARSAAIDDRWIARHAREIDRYVDSRTKIDLTWRWNEACRRVGLGMQISSPLAGNFTGRIPRCVSVDAGPPMSIAVEMPPGVVIADLEHYGEELADAVGAWRLRFRADALFGDRVRVDLIESDPLARPVPFLPPHPPGHVVIGADEWGSTVSTPLDHLTHIVAQGPTRSGKSQWSYQLLAQLVPYVLAGVVDVVGVDPTGSVLEPWGPHPRGWRQWGTRDAAGRYERVLAAVVSEMEQRIERKPPRHDVVPIGPGCPLLVVVLEEWPAVARMTGHTRQKQGPCHKLVSRLLAEGAKAGVRVVTLAQRADADNGGVSPFERDQSLTRLTFGAADAGTVKMLHERDVPDDVLDAQAAAPAGCALLTAPGVPLARIRGPWIGDFSAYWDAVAGVSAA